jgi:hypothetical protein
MIGAMIEIVPSSRIDIFPGLVPHLENATLFLRLRRAGNDQAEKQTCRRRGALTNFHLFPPIGGISSARRENNREGRGRSIRN